MYTRFRPGTGHCINVQKMYIYIFVLVSTCCGEQSQNKQKIVATAERRVDHLNKEQRYKSIELRHYTWNPIRNGTKHNFVLAKWKATAERKRCRQCYADERGERCILKSNYQQIHRRVWKNGRSKPPFTVASSIAVSVYGLSLFLSGFKKISYRFICFFRRMYNFCFFILLLLLLRLSSLITLFTILEAHSIENGDFVRVSSGEHLWTRRMFDGASVSLCVCVFVPSSSHVWVCSLCMDIRSLSWPRHRCLPSNEPNNNKKKNKSNKFSAMVDCVQSTAQRFMSLRMYFLWVHALYIIKCQWNQYTNLLIMFFFLAR